MAKDPIQDAKSRLRQLVGVREPTANYRFLGAEEDDNGRHVIQRKPPMYPTCPAYKNGQDCVDCKSLAECEETYG